MSLGTLIVILQKAELEHDTEIWGKMDPFVIFKYGDVVKESKVVKKGGKMPVWDETFTFDIKSLDDDISFEVMDKETIKKDDFVGGGKLNIAKAVKKGGTLNWYDIKYEVTFEGKVLKE